MSHFKRINMKPLVALLPLLLVVAGLAAAGAGVFVLFGLAWTLIAGGVAATTLGLVMDV